MLKYEIFFQDRKLAEIFWLNFYKEAMFPPHLCTLPPGMYVGNVYANSVELTPCCEAASCTGTQEFPSI
jgi:hypothetical protein